MNLDQMTMVYIIKVHMNKAYMNKAHMNKIHMIKVQRKGECQRLTIARALLKDAPVVHLDEVAA